MTDAITPVRKWRLWLGAAAVVALIAITVSAVREGWFAPKPAIDYSGPISTWDFWGGDSGGTRYSPLTQIDAGNVRMLKPAWTYHVGTYDGPVEKAFAALEATPITAEGRLYICAGNGRIAAIDPETGREIWAHDPKSDISGSYIINCRGVTYGRDTSVKDGETCAGRIYAGTLDFRLVALDSRTGAPCASFGRDGVIDIKQDAGAHDRGDLAISSPPVIIDGKVVVNGRVIDNKSANMPAGAIRAFDMHSGALAWSWNPLPPGRTDAADAPKGEKYVRATPNSWAPMSADPALNLVFIPMGNAPPDHYGVVRNGLDYYSASVVALDAKTGQVRWHFQTVRHDIWDYDLPAQPSLFELPTDAGTVPALAQTTKQGDIYILDRRTGAPLFPVEERPVPAGDIPGEYYSPTQPSPANPAFIIRRDLTEKDFSGFTPFESSACKKAFKEHDYKGVYTPPSTRGWIQNPSFMGASNWGGVTIDPARGILIVNTTQVAAKMRLVPRAEIKAVKGAYPVDGTPYGLSMTPFLSPFGAPCNKTPWGTLTAIDLKAGKRLWEVPLGTTRDRAPWPIWWKVGVPNLGGSLVTASGLVFIAATSDDFIRAFDVRNGKEIWRARLPAGGQANPMTYRLSKDGRQFVVIAAGGNKNFGSKMGDSLVAFALPETPH